MYGRYDWSCLKWLSRFHFMLNYVEILELTTSSVAVCPGQILAIVDLLPALTSLTLSGWLNLRASPTFRPDSSSKRRELENLTILVFMHVKNSCLSLSDSSDESPPSPSLAVGILLLRHLIRFHQTSAERASHRYRVFAL